VKKIVAVAVLISIMALFFSVFHNKHDEKRLAGRAEYAIQGTHYTALADGQFETQGRAEFA